MRKTATVFVTFLVVLGTLAVLPGAGLATAGQDDNQTATPIPEEADDNASISPGERLSVVVGVQEAEINGTLGTRAFGLAVARAASDERVADIVAEQYNETSRDVADIENRMAALNESRADGSIDEGEYQAEVTILAAQAQNARQMANATANASDGLPADLLESKGINASAIQQLKDDANELTGPEVAAIAQRIAGEGTGAQAADARADDRPDDGNQSDANKTEGEDYEGNQSDANQTASEDYEGNHTDTSQADDYDGGGGY